MITYFHYNVYMPKYLGGSPLLLSCIVEQINIKSTNSCLIFIPREHALVNLKVL